MNIARPFIKRPVLTTLLMVAIVVFGVVAYQKLPVASIPAIQYPTIQVTTMYPGASPDEMAKRVSSPLERQFMLMQGIKMVTSTNTYQESTIILQFYLDVDINVAAQETEEAIQKAMGQLPKDLPNNPTYVKVNPSDTPILYLVVYSETMPESQLYEWGYSFLGQQLGTVQGVANINVLGYPYAVRVKVDPQALSARDISLSDLANAINNGNPDQPTGKFYGPAKSMATITDGQLVKADEYNSLIIKFIDGEPVRLSDIGYAEDSIQNDKQKFYWVTKDVPEGMAACVIEIYREIGYNTVEISENIAALLEKLGPQLPKGMELKVPFALATWILQAVADVKFTLLIAFLLVVIVVYLYLGKFLNTLIPIITLPITLTGTFIFMYVLDYSIDILSLSAITLAIGFLIDDAIVVLENIVRWVQVEKVPPYRAALKGAEQIILTVVSISLCLAAVFIPMLFMSGAVGRIFHEFAAVMLISILFSGFISISLTPMLSSRFVPPYSQDKKTKVERLSDWLNEKMLKLYKPSLSFALRHKFSLLVLGLISVGISGYLFLTMPHEFLPETDLGVVQSFLMTPEGTSPEKMHDYISELADISIKNPYVETVAYFESTPTDNQSMFFLNLVERAHRPNIWKVMDEIQKDYDRVIGTKVFQKAFPLINLQIGDVTAGKAQYQYTMQSFNTEVLYETAIEFIEELKSLSQLKNVSTNFLPNSPTLNVDILRDQAHSYSNLNAMSVENAFKYAYGETYISKINVPQNMYYVILELEKQFLRDPSQLSKLYLGQGENQVSMSSVIDSEIISSPQSVDHINALTSVTVDFDPAPGVPLSTAITAVQNVANKLIPDTVMGSLAGNTEEFEKSTRQFSFLLLLAIFVIYVILGMLYENFLYPIAALASVPIATLGGLVSLLIFGKALSIYALIGLVMLLGIVMKNGILVIDFALELMRDKNLDATTAAHDACLIRFRPIIMTTIAAMMGAVPIAVGIGGTVAEGRSPLGIAVVGGLIFSQAVTLYLTPVIFVYISRLNNAMVRKFSLFQEKAE